MAGTTGGYGIRHATVVFLNNRYHDPTLGNFISVDPLVAKTRMPYSYGAGNPITYSDPSGLEPQSWVETTTLFYVVASAPRYFGRAAEPWARQAGVDEYLLASLTVSEGTGYANATQLGQRLADGANNSVRDSRRGYLGLHEDHFDEAKAQAAESGVAFGYDWPDISGDFGKSLQSQAWYMAFLEDKIRTQVGKTNGAVVDSFGEVPAGAKYLRMAALVAGTVRSWHYFVGAIDLTITGIPLGSPYPNGDVFDDLIGYGYANGVVERSDKWQLPQARSNGRGD